MQNGAREGDQLLLAGGQAAAALADRCVIALVHLLDEGVRVHQLGGAHGVLRAGFGVGVAQVVHHGAGEQMRLLQHIAQAGLQPQLAAFPVILPINKDAALGGLIKAAKQVHNGGFAGARGPYNGDGLTRLDLQVEVAQHLLAVLVAEGDIAKLHLPGDGFPVFPLGVEVVPIAGDDLLGILDIRLRLQQTHHALGRSLDALQLRKRGRDVPDGVEKLHRVADKGGQRAQGDHPAQHAAGALAQDQGGGDGGHGNHQRHKQGGQGGGADGRPFHGAGQIHKLGHVLLLAHQGLGGLGAHDALVEAAGDAGVDLAHLALRL